MINKTGILTGISGSYFLDKGPERQLRTLYFGVAVVSQIIFIVAGKIMLVKLRFSLLPRSNFCAWKQEVFFGGYRAI